MAGQHTKGMIGHDPDIADCGLETGFGDAAIRKSKTRRVVKKRHGGKFAAGEAGPGCQAGWLWFVAKSLLSKLLGICKKIVRLFPSHWHCAC